VNRGIVFIFATVFLDMLGLGIIAPVLPKLVLTFTGGDGARAAAIFGIFGTVFALMQFVCSPLLGVLSDRFGRRPVIVLSNFGLGLDYVLMALAPTVSWLFAGRLISGITSASMTTASAYVADVAQPEQRAAGFGLLGAAFGLGFIAGPAIGGLLGGVDPRLPFWFAAALSLANAAYGFFVLPESLQREQQRAILWRRANPFGALKLLRSRHQLLGLATVAFLSTLAGVVLPSIYVLYVSYRYGWDTRAVGFSLALVGVCSALAQAALVKPVVAHLGERGAMLAGLLCGAAGMAIFGAATTGTLFAFGIPLMALWGLAPAAAQSIMTRRVSASEQGQLQGALGSLASVASLVGPGLFTLIYARSIDGHGARNLPGAAWLLSTLMLLGAAILMLRVTGSAPSEAAEVLAGDQILCTNSRSRAEK
jgi:DHA1 family tetracycline resistance protein-like MFS transporter